MINYMQLWKMPPTYKNIWLKEFRKDISKNDCMQLSYSIYSKGSTGLLEREALLHFCIYIFATSELFYSFISRLHLNGKTLEVYIDNSRLDGNDIADIKRVVMYAFNDVPHNYRHLDANDYVVTFTKSEMKLKQNQPHHN